MDTLNNGVNFGWVAYLDIYGFTAESLEQNARDLRVRLNRCHTKTLQMITSGKYRPVCLLYQDTVILFHPTHKHDSEDKLLNLQRSVGDVQEILGIFLEEELPLRGGIAFGEVTYGPHFIFGPAAYNAMKYEKLVAAPFVLLPTKEHVIRFTNQKHYLSTAAPRPITIELKSGEGITSGSLYYPTPIERFIEFTKIKYNEHLVSEHPRVAKAWKNAWVFIDEKLQLMKGDNP